MSRTLGSSGKRPAPHGVGSGVKLEIWSDVICPWCYIGKRRIEAALERFEHADEVEVLWRSFELAPGAPARSRRPMVEQLAAKYGRSIEESHRMLAHMDEVAAAEGLDYHLEETTGGSSFDAHRLIHAAAGHGRAGEAKEALLHAYFVERVAVSDHDVLRRVGAQVGLDPAEVDDLLAGDRFADAVRADEEEAVEMGATGVPFAVVGRTFVLPGAQDADTVVSVLRRAWDRTHPAPGG